MLRPGLELAALMGYEAHIAGLGDRPLPKASLRSGHRPLLARPQLQHDPAAFCLERPEQPKAKVAHFRIQFGVLSAGIQHLSGC